MARSEGQSDFAYRAPEPALEREGASPVATRWIYRLLVVVLIALFVVVFGIGHMPSGG